MPAPFTGNFYFVDPVNGSDGNRGTDVDRAFQTLYKGHAACTSGKNDVVFLIGNGLNTGTARLTLTSAQLIDPTVTVATLVWSKDATHLIGIGASSNNDRARIAPATADTITTFASGNMVTVSGSGCTFANFSAFQGFATGGANEICWTDTGGRNNYVNVQFLGGGDAGSATTNATTLRSLLINSSVGEHVFTGCTIGLTTVVRATGSQELEVRGGASRVTFNQCTIETWAGAAGCFWFKVGAVGADRFVLFRNCTFINPVIGAGATAMTTGFSINANPGGAILTQDCLFYGADLIDSAGRTYGNIANAGTAGGRSVAVSA
jgi:hypothetical protein